MFSYSCSLQLKKHTEAKYQCPYCSKKFHYISALEDHATCCADFKYVCDLCGQKFYDLCRLENHKERVHHAERPLKNANIVGADCTEEQKQHSDKKADASQEMSSCINCRVSFTTTDELMNHKVCMVIHDCFDKYHTSCFASEEYQRIIRIVKQTSFSTQETIQSQK